MPAAVEWLGTSSPTPALSQRSFNLQAEAERIPGLLWRPTDYENRRGPLVLVGHAGFSHKASKGMLELASALAGRGFAALALDAPLHGERREGSLADPWKAWMAYWKRTAAADFASHWSMTVDAIQAQGEVRAGPIGYWGISLGTQYGIALLARERRITAAVLGMFGLARDERLARLAKSVTCAVHFIQRESDEIWPVSETDALFECLGSVSKQKRRSPGGHFDLGDADKLATIQFLEAGLVSNE